MYPRGGIIFVLDGFATAGWVIARDASHFDTMAWVASNLGSAATICRSEKMEAPQLAHSCGAIDSNNRNGG